MLASADDAVWGQHDESNFCVLRGLAAVEDLLDERSKRGDRVPDRGTMRAPLDPRPTKAPENASQSYFKPRLTGIVMGRAERNHKVELYQLFRHSNTPCRHCCKHQFRRLWSEHVKRHDLGFLLRHTSPTCMI